MPRWLPWVVLAFLAGAVSRRLLRLGWRQDE